jgi:hypothetical protein
MPWWERERLNFMKRRRQRSVRRKRGLFPVERRILAGHSRWRERTRLILLLFGGIPNSPCFEEKSFEWNASAMASRVEDNRGSGPDGWARR